MWEQDRSQWSNTDELLALSVESLNHWLPALVAVMAAKGTKLKPPARTIEHPDRPGVPDGDGGSSEKKGGSSAAGPMTVSEFEAKQKEGR